MVYIALGWSNEVSEKFILRTIDYPIVFINALSHIREKYDIPLYNSLADTFCEEFDVSLTISENTSCEIIFESEAHALFFILRWS